MTGHPVSAIRITSFVFCYIISKLRFTKIEYILCIIVIIHIIIIVLITIIISVNIVVVTSSTDRCKSEANYVIHRVFRLCRKNIVSFNALYDNCPKRADFCNEEKINETVRKAIAMEKGGR